MIELCTACLFDLVVVVVSFYNLLKKTPFVGFFFFFSCYIFLTKSDDNDVLKKIEGKMFMFYNQLIMKDLTVATILICFKTVFLYSYMKDTKQTIKKGNNIKQFVQHH